MNHIGIPPNSYYSYPTYESTNFSDTIMVRGLQRLTIPLMELQSPVLRLLDLEGCFCYDESELINQADITIYKQLLEIDSKLGTTQTEQLFSSFSDVSVGFILTVSLRL